MKLKLTVASSVAVLALLGGAMAKQLPGQGAADFGESRAPSSETTAGDTIVQIAEVTEQIAQFAATTVIAPSTGPTARIPVKVASAAKATTAAPVKAAAAAHGTPDKLAGKSPDMAADRREQLSFSDAKPMAVLCVGRPETGKAAWYGGRYVGRRTTSGERLNSIHATAAHRTLPLNSLARVTNLQNGRSVIVKVTDRGPGSESLLIDMSPRAADQLAMKQQGIVPVKVEQVVEVSSNAK